MPEDQSAMWTIGALVDNPKIERHKCDFSIKNTFLIQVHAVAPKSNKNHTQGKKGSEGHAYTGHSVREAFFSLTL